MNEEFPLIGQSFIKGGNRSGSPDVAIQMRAEATEDQRERENLAFDMHMAKVIGECLHSFYRGHFWKVEVSAKQGVAFIGMPILLGNWKYVMPLHQYSTQHVIRAGGEILERFKIPRSSLDVGLAQFVEARKSAVSRPSHTPPGGVRKRAAA